MENQPANSLPRLVEVRDVKHPILIGQLMTLQWAIEPSYFQKILGIVTSGGDITQAEQDRQDRRKSFKAALGLNLKDTADEEEYDNLYVHNGIGIINVMGPIVPRADWFTKMCGIASADGIMGDFHTALNSDKVEKILFNISSPGGSVEGISELAQAIAEGRARKNITMFTGGMAASAAYWIASAGHKIYGSNTSLVGSVGVVSTYTDTSERDAKNGVKRYEIVSGVSPKKRLSPATEEGRTSTQTLVDDLAEVMVGSIAKNRGISVEKVLSDFGEGDVMIMSKAVSSGMADGVKTLSGLVLELSSKPKQRNSFMELNAMQASDLKAANPSLYESIMSLGRTEGATAERTRIQDIESIQAPGHEKLIKEKKFDPTATKASLSTLIVEADAASREKGKKNMNQDGEKVRAQTERSGDSPVEASETEVADAARVMADAMNTSNASRKAA